MPGQVLEEDVEKCAESGLRDRGPKWMAGLNTQPGCGSKETLEPAQDFEAGHAERRQRKWGGRWWSRGRCLIGTECACRRRTRRRRRERVKKHHDEGQPAPVVTRAGYTYKQSHRVNDGGRWAVALDGSASLRQTADPNAARVLGRSYYWGARCFSNEEHTGFFGGGVMWG
ncbi:hypothetical protein C8R44DRAFT_753190 [Mycena epipterygia]|nr:hypothetical protein C8R44DRAFT_753190 [Mycena epipterygia]